ncbi:LANO_0G07162g1_1 [Lachancea nothofagi CBS 11611]|uniref:LANO_0G07162g1_1 n=1 Tax=Lachancea nothofagi CBS 11611 TaxID=1266666 RepID=A0A1G4KHA6_9SACH|nr:LANO_0G07162g1_1 [Lachancea nothofagi CBS 11611]
MDTVIQCFEHRFSCDILRNFIRYDTAYPSGTMLLREVKNEKLRQFFQYTLELKQEFSTNCMSNGLTVELFDLGNEQLKLLNRLADGETAWITDPMYLCAKQLLGISKLLDKQNASLRSAGFNKQKAKGDLEDEKFLEKCVRTIHTSFKLCLNDRNPNACENKKWGVYLFTNLELKIYKMLYNRDMVRNLVKVMDSRVSELPTPENALQLNKAQLVTYYYYMAEYYGCHEIDFERGYEFARKAWLSSRGKGGSQENTIMLLLVPFAMLARKWYPDLQILRAKYPLVAGVYEPVIKCLQNGDLFTFGKWLDLNESFLLRQNLFVAMVMIRELVLLKVLKLSFQFFGSGPIVSLKYVAAAVTKSESHQGVKQVPEEKLDSTECMLANLISKNYIKGYLSHSNRALVVSKTNAFPKLAATHAQGGCP